MTHPNNPRPIVLEQIWVATLPDGTRCDAGSSYHLSEVERAAYVQQIASRLTGPDTEQEEPIGEPIPIHVPQHFYQEIVKAGGSYRVK